MPKIAVTAGRMDLMADLQLTQRCVGKLELCTISFGSHLLGNESSNIKAEHEHSSCCYFLKTIHHFLN